MDLEESIADIRDAIKQCTDSDLGWIIRNLGPKDLLAVYLITDNVDVQRNLLTQGPVKSVSNMLDILSYHEKAEVLKYMCNERRLGVVGTWCKEKKSKELQRLDKWQLQEDNAWRWGLADTRVWTHGMDKRLPGHYPVNMNRCAMFIVKAATKIRAIAKAVTSSNIGIACVVWYCSVIETANAGSFTMQSRKHEANPGVKRAKMQPQSEIQKAGTYLKT
ncbi:hypothetical protein PSV08DRAFT_250820 [Bipolaris maydis]|uniref:uncharacterized protein n=1 Tax=Cochliobolus heterostrophus TaxID=5016 RepID=UPI0024D54A6F|nr:hypothetical protein PSV08DRAFT_250820 [Bipolaris maydis]